jgi:hypothetical protein
MGRDRTAVSIEVKSCGGEGGGWGPFLGEYTRKR